jgi:hypothetical protein
LKHQIGREKIGARKSDPTGRADLPTNADFGVFTGKLRWFVSDYHRIGLRENLNRKPWESGAFLQIVP